MISQVFRANRLEFTPQELAKYRGRWVAFRADGRAVVDNAETLDALENQLAASGVDAEQVVFEHVPAEDICLGGLEF